MKDFCITLLLLHTELRTLNALFSWQQTNWLNLFQHLLCRKEAIDCTLLRTGESIVGVVTSSTVFGDAYILGQLDKFVHLDLGLSCSDAI